MKLDKNLKILIVGLGLIGGSYAMGFTKKALRSRRSILTKRASILL